MAAQRTAPDGTNRSTIMPTSVVDAGIENVTPGPDKNVFAGATVAAASGGEEGRVNLEVGGTDTSQEGEAAPDGTDRSTIMPTPVADAGVEDETPGSKKKAAVEAQAAAAGGKADSRVNLEVDPAVTNFSTFPPPPVNNRQEWPPGWSTAPKPPPPGILCCGEYSHPAGCC